MELHESYRKSLIPYGKGILILALILGKFICPKNDLNSLQTIPLENLSTRLKKSFATQLAIKW
jgi:hypothetical protein